MKKYGGPERRAGKWRERIIKVLGKVLSEHLQFDREVVSAQDLFGEVILLGREEGDGVVKFHSFFREFSAIAEAEDVEEPIRKTAKFIFLHSHYLDRKEYFDQRHPQ